MPSYFSLYYCDEHMPTGQTDGVMLTKKPQKNKQDNNKLISTYSTAYANSKTSHWQLIYAIQNPKTQAPDVLCDWASTPALEKHLFILYVRQCCFYFLVLVPQNFGVMLPQSYANPNLAKLQSPPWNRMYRTSCWYAQQTLVAAQGPRDPWSHNWEVY